MSAAPVPPGGTVGVLGGGQLGRMLAMAAAKLGLKTHIYAPEANPPASDVAAHHMRAAYDDEAALQRFAASVDVVTYEFENVPVEAVETLAPLVPARPGARALGVAQDRLEEKRFLNQIGAATAPYMGVRDHKELDQAITALGTPAILKTRRFGYDGKGQARIEAASDADIAFAAIGTQPAVLEGFVEFEREVSLIAARGPSGRFAAYDPVENVHADRVLSQSFAPAELSASATWEIVTLATAILERLDYVGVMGIEMFVTELDDVIVNEIAPRVHNSGHWTLEACAVSQFEQHIRAVCGWPLGDGARHSDAVMTNLLGADADDWPRVAGDARAGLHLYGKGEARPGRKMGHVTKLYPLGARPGPEAEEDEAFMDAEGDAVDEIDDMEEISRLDEADDATGAPEPARPAPPQDDPETEDGR